MPGFRHCHWCNGKGCIACDAEEQKWKARKAAEPEPTGDPVVRLVASLLRTSPGAIEEARRKVADGCDGNPNLIPSVPGWEADRFRYCPGCDGGGCPRCPDSRASFIRAAVETAPAWRPGDIRDVRDAAIGAEAERAGRNLDALTEDEIEAAFMPAMDAEYKRQFPDGPKPVASFSLDDTALTGWIS